MKRVLILFLFSIVVITMISGCATVTPKPLAYIAIEKPTDIVNTANNKGVESVFSRGGWYFGNYNFRPAPNMMSYIEEAQKKSGNKILKNADVQLGIPFYFDILFFGYNHCEDRVTAQ
jgi:hypothetical protein